MKSVIIYLCVICITLLAAIITGGEFLAFLLGFELVLPAFLYVLVRYFSQNLKVQLKVPALAEKGEEVNLEVVLKNTGKLPISSAQVEIACLDVFDDRQITGVVGGVIDSGSSSTIRLTMTAEYAGRIKFQVENIRVYDYFHMIGREVPFDKAWSQLLVAPEIRDVLVDKEFENMRISQDGESHSQDRSGDDVAEVYDVREFRAGDALHKIHWKLSAKTDDLLVKEFSDPLQKALLIFVDFYMAEPKEWTHERFDRMATTLASVSDKLLQQKETHEVIWYDAKEGQVHWMTIAKKEDIYETVGELSIRKPYSQAFDFQSVLRENGLYGQETKGFLIDTEGVLNRMEK